MSAGSNGCKLVVQPCPGHQLTKVDSSPGANASVADVKLLTPREPQPSPASRLGNLI